MNISHYCGDFTALTTTRFGDKIYVDTRDTSLAPHLLVAGDWEPWVTGAFHDVLMRHPKSVVIDVGANVGWYTLLACRFGRHPVMALEPHPRLAGLLRKTVAVNGYGSLVAVREIGADSAIGSRRLRYLDAELGGATFADTADAKFLHTVVHCDTLDHTAMFSAGPSLERAIIKIDVEGSEADVLRGASELLALKPVLFLEHHKGLSLDYMGLLSETHTLQEIRHTGHPGPELDLAGLDAVGEAETLLCLPREDSGD